MFTKSYINEWMSYLTEDSKYKGLDLLRAIAIFFVLVWHFDQGLFRIGWTGVDLFFVLSGFLIGNVLMKSISKESFKYTEYLWHRFLRIYPLYIVSVVVYLS